MKYNSSHIHNWKYKIRNADDEIVGKQCKKCGKEKSYVK